jgi:hypothetical protein
MPGATLIEGPDDLNRVVGYADQQGFFDHVQNQTDLEVELIVEDEYVHVLHDLGGTQWGQMTFTYPFEAEEIVQWVYHFESDYSIRYEVLRNVENFLELPVREDDSEDDEVERTERVLEFVRVLLWERWIDLDGSDLLIMDPEGGPLELTCSFRWVTEFVGEFMRPHRPSAGQPTIAKLYSDGRLALAWPVEEDVAQDQRGVERPLPDLVIVDLAVADDPQSFYEISYREHPWISSTSRR